MWVMTRFDSLELLMSQKNDLGVRQYIERVFQDTIREVGDSESLEASEIAGLRNWLWRQADLPRMGT